MTAKESQAQSELASLPSVVAPSGEFDLVDQILFGKASGRSVKKGSDWEKVRPLSESDIEAIEQGAASSVATPSLKSLGARHHSIAQKIAQGMSSTDISLITGYTPQYVNQLKNDPAFKELIEYYSSQVELKFVDVVDRMKQLGVSAVEELQRRIDEKPEEMSNGVLRDIAETMIIKPVQAMAQAKAAANGTGGIQKVQIEFVKAKVEPQIIEGTQE